MAEDSGILGGVEVTPEDLVEMQRGDYVLHGCGGGLTRVPVEKIQMPLDPEGHLQRLCLVTMTDGTVYAAQHTIFSRSTDGGATWEHLERDPTPFGGWRLQDAGDGRLLNIASLPPHGIFISADRGESWEQTGQLDLPEGGSTEIGFSVARQGNGGLLVPLLHRQAQTTDDFGKVLSGANTCYICRSEDGGRIFAERAVLGDWCHEVNIVPLPSGRLLAVIRYQRGFLPDDPPDLGERTGAAVFGSSFPYKHVFVADSEDGGHTWSELRQLTKIFGQCYGSGVGLSGDRVVVVHDHRYPREVGSGRAMVSRDGGRSWGDEVYYLNHDLVAGYAATVSLDGEEMLTLAGVAGGDAGDSWDNCVGNSRFSVIRWRLV